jgi:hypothetical protein
MPNAPQDEILIGGNFTVSITGCDQSSKDCVSFECDPIEIEMQDVTQSNDTTWKTFTSGQPRFGEARMTFRKSAAASCKDLSTWVDDVRRGANIRKAITVSIKKKDKSSDGRVYNLIECFPVSYSEGDYTTAAEANLAEIRVMPTRVEIAS